MQYRYSLFSIFLVLAISGFTMKKNTKTNGGIRWVVSQNSSLSVNGSTNINKFSCVIPAYDQQDTLTVAADKEDQGIALTGRIRLPVSSFDCHISAMTRQLRETLKAKQFPALYIRFSSLSRLPEITALPERITGLVDIEIAGVSKRFEVSYQLSRDERQVIHLQGMRTVNFSDFNLAPPTKLGGMIKTRDALSVDFQLNMKELN
jgi:hypothetical protein